MNLRNIEKYFHVPMMLFVGLIPTSSIIFLMFSFPRENNAFTTVVVYSFSIVAVVCYAMFARDIVSSHFFSLDLKKKLIVFLGK